MTACMNASRSKLHRYQCQIVDQVIFRSKPQAIYLLFFFAPVVSNKIHTTRIARIVRTHKARHKSYLLFISKQRKSVFSSLFYLLLAIVILSFQFTQYVKSTHRLDEQAKKNKIHKKNNNNNIVCVVCALHTAIHVRQTNLRDLYRLRVISYQHNLLYEHFKIEFLRRL